MRNAAKWQGKGHAISYLVVYLPQAHLSNPFSFLFSALVPPLLTNVGILCYWLKVRLFMPLAFLVLVHLISQQALQTLWKCEALIIYKYIGFNLEDILCVDL